jgi:hypothetical protein
MMMGKNGTQAGKGYVVHCIPAEDLLPQRKHTGSWDEAYLTPEKYVHNFSTV